MPLTREQWDGIARARIAALMFNGRVKAEVAIRHANETTEQDYGPRPDAEPKPEKPKGPDAPWWLRLVLRLTVGKETGSMGQRIIVALAYALTAAIAAWQTGGTPQTPEGWIALGVAFITAFWAKFSSSTTLISPMRPGETQATKPGVTL